MKKYLLAATVAALMSATMAVSASAAVSSQDEIKMLRAEIQKLVQRVDELQKNQGQQQKQVELQQQQVKELSKFEPAAGGSAAALAHVEPAAGGPNWAGFYAGAQLGLAHSNTDYGDLDDYYDNQEMNALTDFGVIGGLFGGYNVQHGSTVYGVEAGVNMLSNEDRSCVGDPDCSETLTTDFKGIATLKARGGFIHDNSLFYVAAGPALARVDFENNDDASVFSEADWRWGYAAAIGVENIIGNNLALRLQAEHVSLNDETINDTVNATPFGETSQNTSLTAGLAWLFN